MGVHLDLFSVAPTEYSKLITCLQVRVRRGEPSRALTFDISRKTEKWWDGALSRSFSSKSWKFNTVWLQWEGWQPLPRADVTDILQQQGPYFRGPDPLRPCLSVEHHQSVSEMASSIYPQLVHLSLTVDETAEGLSWGLRNSECETTLAELYLLWGMEVGMFVCVCLNFFCCQKALAPLGL